jgi:hypothetical protein
LPSVGVVDALESLVWGVFEAWNEWIAERARSSDVSMAVEDIVLIRGRVWSNFNYKTERMVKAVTCIGRFIEVINWKVSGGMGWRSLEVYRHGP